MNHTWSVRLQNASGRPWTFFVFQRPLHDDGRIASLAWIASPSTVADGEHATLMWDDDMALIWCTHAGHDAPMPFTAGGQYPVDRDAEHGVLFNLDDNAPNLEPCAADLAPGPTCITVAANVPNNVYGIGMEMDGARALMTMALLAQRYDFAPCFWIGASHDIVPGQILTPATTGPCMQLQFAANVHACSFTLNDQDQWQPVQGMALDAGHSIHVNGHASQVPPAAMRPMMPVSSIPTSTESQPVQLHTRLALGFDTDTPLTAASAAHYAAAGYVFCLRYIARGALPHRGDLDAAEARLIGAAGLGLMPVQHVAAQWLPTAALGSEQGENAGRHAHAAHVPPGINVWLDLEDVDRQAHSADIVAYCQSWYDAVAHAGYAPGLYVGANCGLHAQQLEALPFEHYWKSMSDVPEIPSRGYQMVQMRQAGEVDVDWAGADALGGMPVWWKQTP